MSFTPNIPNTGQSLGFTKAPIRINMAVLRSTIAVNHYDVNDALAGKHIYSVYPSQGTDPATTATEGAIYTKLISGQINEVFRSKSSGSVYQLTAVDDTNFSTFGTFTNYAPAVVNQNGGWTFLPGGLLLQYGTMITTGNTQIIKFPIAFSTVYSVTPVASKEGCILFSKTNTQFTVAALSGFSGALINWMAVGKQ